MRLGLKRSVTLLAIFSVALHVVLLGVAPLVAGGSAAADPFSVICHSGAQAGAPEAPAKADFAPGDACEHCNLCSVAATPSAPDVVFATVMAPVPVLHVLRPIPARARAGITSDPKLARGPPQFV